MNGSVEKATLSYIVRDHSASLFDARIETLRHIEKIMNEKYGAGTVKLDVKESYRNMKEVILPHIHLVENAKRAIEMAGLTPSVEPIRGGTDGARLSFMGLPCPNLGTGGYAFHGPFEHISAEGMELATEILHNILKIYAEKN
jgi:tripeptide aminopeptidase